MDLRLDRQRLDEVLRTLGRNLDGEWLLIGGALVALWLEPRRVTQDIDLIGLKGDPGERLRLMEAAEAANLPIEAVNSAADFFVRRIPDWRTQLEPFLTEERATIFRPSPTLFLLLKLARMSEQDLEDCRALLRKAREEKLEVDRPRILAALEASAEGDEGVDLRRELLAQEL